MRRYQATVGQRDCTRGRLQLPPTRRRDRRRGNSFEDASDSEVRVLQSKLVSNDLQGERTYSPRQIQNPPPSRGSRGRGCQQGITHASQRTSWDSTSDWEAASRRATSSSSPGPRGA